MIITCPHCTAQYVVEPEHFGLAPRAARCSGCGHVWQAEAEEEQAPALAAALAGMLGGAPDPERLAADKPDTDGELWDDKAADEVPLHPAPPLAAPLNQVTAATPPPPPLPAQSNDAVAEDSELDLALGGDDELHPATAAPVEATDADVPSSVLAADRAVAEADANERRRKHRLILFGTSVGTLALTLALLLALQRPITHAIPGMAALYHLVGLAPPPPGADLDIGNVASSREWAGNDDVLVVSGAITNTAKAARNLPPLRVTLFDAADRAVQETIIEAEKPVLAPNETVHFTARIVSPASTAKRMVVSFDTTADAL